MPTLDVNFLAVLVATIVHQALGFVWYGPVFGELWLESVGKTRDELDQPGAAIAIAVLASFLTALALALVLTLVDAPDMGDGIVLGLIAAVGFVATSMITQAAFDARNTTGTILFVGYQLIGVVVMGAILGAWR